MRVPLDHLRLLSQLVVVEAVDRVRRPEQSATWFKYYCTAPILTRFTEMEGPRCVRHTLSRTALDQPALDRPKDGGEADGRTPDRIERNVEPDIVGP